MRAVPCDTDHGPLAREAARVVISMYVDIGKPLKLLRDHKRYIISMGFFLTKINK